MRWLSILVLMLGLVAAGCGGGDDDSSASAETTIEETTSETTTTEDDGSGSDTGGDFDFADEDCQALLGIGATIAAAFSAAGGGTAADTEELAELADKVPDEIAADVQRLADAYGQYAAKLQDIGIEAGATPSAEQVQEFQAAIASLDQQELTAASQRVQAWATENCTG